jgi:hypothetical protein
MRNTMKVIGTALLFGTATLAYAMTPAQFADEFRVLQAESSGAPAFHSPPMSSGARAWQPRAHAMSARGRRAIAASNAAFDRSIAACNRLPISERGICKVESHGAYVASIPQGQRR